MECSGWHHKIEVSLLGEWEDTAPYVRSAPELAAVDEMVEDLYVESDIGQVFTVDLGTAGWSYLDQEVPSVVSGAVQVYELAEEDTEAPLVEISGLGSEAVEKDAGEVEETESELDEELPPGEEAAEDGTVEEEDLKKLESPQSPADPGSAKANPPAKDPKKESQPAEPAPAGPPPGKIL